jgi:hypothetical protein
MLLLKYFSRSDVQPPRAFLISALVVIYKDKIWAYMKRPEESMMEKKSNTTHKIRTK